ncbi:MAG: orotidine 5'-phosphate decarboxylase / HUMPS family protein, partial [Lactobacillaceae bacterium]
GTPLVIDEGMHAVRRMIKEFPNKEVLSDEKIMDGGYHEADLGYQAGAKYVTVLGVAEDKTIQGCLDAAHDADAILVVDTLKIPNLAERAKEVEAMGVHFISVHTGFDQQQMGRTPLNDLRIVKANTNSI